MDEDACTVQQIKKKAGIELDIQQTCPASAFSEQKINLLFASGDLPNIIFNWGPSGN